MATASDPDELVEEFLQRTGHDQEPTWDRSYNKLQCPECGGLHEQSATACSVCGWQP